MLKMEMTLNGTRTDKARKVTLLGFFVNLLLSAVKLIVGMIGHSSAMVADAVHSISDFATDLVVLGFLRVSDKESDRDHRYGHGKFETLATLLISMVLLFVGFSIFFGGMHKIFLAISGKVIEQPSLIALITALVSILLKEWIYQYTLKVGNSINNQAVIANAWHHRSDAFSSIGTLLGITGAIFLGEKWRLLDPLAGVIVSCIIIYMAFRLGLPSAKELMEVALPDQIEKEIIEIVTQTSGVRDYHRLKTRRIGNVIAIDMHVKLDGNLTLRESHRIVSRIERKIFKKYGKRTHINIHMEPYMAYKISMDSNGKDKCQEHDDY